MLLTYSDRDIYRERKLESKRGSCEGGDLIFPFRVEFSHSFSVLHTVGEREKAEKGKQTFRRIREEEEEESHSFPFDFFGCKKASCVVEFALKMQICLI